MTKVDMDKWHKRHLDLARFISQWSKDPRKRVGAVVTEDNYVRGVGYNGFPRGIADTAARLADQTIKLQVTLHAEVNALAAAYGRGDSIYVYPCLPCPQCLSQIIQWNIKNVITTAVSMTKETKWAPDFVLSLAEEAKINVILI